MIIALNINVILQNGCASSQNLNDFFGIEMPEEEADNFKIVSYEVKRGANYYSNSRMNTQIYAWAEIQPQIVKIKVVNTSETNLPTSYTMDQFTVFTKEGGKFILLNGDRITYPTVEKIAPNKSVEYSLQFPMNFWQSAGLATSGEMSPNSYRNFWKGENSLQLVKEQITMIKVTLGGKITLIMKPVP